MNTKEFIRIQLDATPNAVRAWLDSAADAAQQIGERTFCVASLEMDADASDPSNPDSTPHRRRYGVFNGDGVLVLNAELHRSHEHTTVLELRRDDAFPLIAEELMRRLQDRFPGAGGEMLAEKPRVRAGAPPLACNVWLEEQMRRLPDPARYHHLYATWLEHYVTLRGYEPLDPRRSFRAAARGCLRRLRAQNRT